MTPSTNHVTALLLAWGRGDRDAFEQLVPIVHDELLRLARRAMRREQRQITLQPTALVNEAFVRLVDGTSVPWQDRAHFFAVAARTMRRILVDAARARAASKRGGDIRQVTFDEALTLAPDRGIDLVSIDDALAELATLDTRKSQVVEMRFFGGLTVEETAATLGVSAETVARDWRFAKAWLSKQLRGGEPAARRDGPIA